MLKLLFLVSQYSKPSQFFSFAIHVLYAIVLGSSFSIAAQVFVPVENAILSPDRIANAIATFVVYFVLVAGWVSYSLAILRNPHMPNEKGALRFGIDIVIMTLLFYLVNLTNPIVFANSFWHAFVWILPALFFTYGVWDVVELREYQDADKKTRNAIWAQLTKSTLGFILVVFQLIAFSLAAWHYHLPNWVMYIGFSITTFFIVLYYRINSWKIARFKRGSVKERRP